MLYQIKVVVGQLLGVEITTKSLLRLNIRVKSIALDQEIAAGPGHASHIKSIFD